MFTQIKNFVAAAISGYSMSASGTRVAIATYGSKFSLVNNLTPSKATLYTALNTMQPIGGIRQIGVALMSVQGYVFDAMTRRNNAGKVVVLFTTGPNDIGGASLVQKSVQLLASNKVEIAVVDIGNGFKIGLLQSIVTSKSNFFQIGLPHQLPNLIHNILILSVPALGNFIVY